MTKEQIGEFTLRTSQENHSGLVLVLCDIVVTYIDDAIKAYDEEAIEDLSFAAEHAKTALNELIKCFNPKDENGAVTIEILRYIYKLLVKSAIKRKPVELDRAIKLLKDLRVAFEHLHELDTDMPVMQNTHKVYAGLTYGKGTLNESIYTDVAKRGFTI